MRLFEMLSVIPFYQTNKTIDPSIEVNNIQMDSNQIEYGDLFICIKGFTVDGHDFAKQAVDNGAIAVIAADIMPELDVIVIVVPDTMRALALISAKFFNYPTEKIHLTGITGTNGKTTTTYLIEEIYKLNGLKTGLIGTIQVKIGNEIQSVKNTTPDALELQQIFHHMVESNVGTAVMEVSSHALDIGRVYGCSFDIAVFTNLTQDHLDYHRDMEDYLRAKMLLFTGLGNGYGEQAKYAVLNVDDMHSATIKRSTSQPVITYGIHSQADIMAKDIRYDTNGMTFTITTPTESIKIKSRLIGKFNIYNILAAVTVAILRNIPVHCIRKAIENSGGVAGRFEQIIAGQNYTVIVDYAHTPDSLQNVLETINDFAENKIYVVVGTGGDRDRTKRPLMAKVALDYADWAILTSDNPRTEEPEKILEDMTRDLTGTNFQAIQNRREAIYHAIALAKSGDVVLIAGKGHETYQEIHGVRYEFDDRIIAKEAIEKKEQ